MNKTVLITGASSGIGEALAREFAFRGYDIAVRARRLENLASLQQDIQRQWPTRRVQIEALDVTDCDAVLGSLASAQAELGPLSMVGSAAAQAAARAYFGR